MLTLRRLKKFKIDFKKLNEDQKYDLCLVVEQLMKEEELDQSLKDHQLTGNYEGCRDCHIKPDLVLIYSIKGNELLLIRVGNHAELF